MPRNLIRLIKKLNLLMKTFTFASALVAISSAADITKSDHYSADLTLAEVSAEVEAGCPCDNSCGCNHSCGHGCYSHCGCHNHCDCDSGCDTSTDTEPEPDCYELTREEMAPNPLGQSCYPMQCYDPS